MLMHSLDCRSLVLHARVRAGVCVRYRGPRLPLDVVVPVAVLHRPRAIVHAEHVGSSVFGVADVAELPFKPTLHRWLLDRDCPAELLFDRFSVGRYSVKVT